MTAEGYRPRIFDVVQKEWPLCSGDEIERAQEAWRIADRILPMVLRAMAEQVEEDANVEALVLRTDPWGKPYLVPRRDVLMERAKGLRKRAGEEGRL
jgi:hypothetical protein